MCQFEGLARRGDTIAAELIRPELGLGHCYVQGVVMHDAFTALDGTRGYLVRVCLDVQRDRKVADRVGREICVPFDLGAGDWRDRVQVVERSAHWLPAR